MSQWEIASGIILVVALVAIAVALMVPCFRRLDRLDDR